ncbi:MAG: 3D-(3,5/4)-trihydroxycyclohexane-1,2-dione acylhydrolase (decyclizing) [Thermomicrobiales bacterium]|nr:3D-(3,5/4)-trihydroxycyclohexane-1,2-dione acylhydrolase (decyclizing) [Thermomicrobiales bacterium]
MTMRIGTTRLTMAQAVVKFLTQQYTERDGVEQPLIAGVWGIFGHGNVAGIGQALEELKEEVAYHRPQNEQGMVHAAAAYAKMKNRLQTFACTSSIGPGATNMLTGAAMATVNRLPVLLLPGDIFASRRPDPVLQQLEFPLSMDVSVNDAFFPVSRFWDRINRPEQLLASLPEAMRVLTDQAETGAVTICLPQDVQIEAYDYPAAFFEKRVYRVPRIVPPREALERAAAMIRAAEQPLIVAGGGVIYSEATAALSDFADALGIPVTETQAGKGALPWNHAWNAGAVGSNGGLAANRLARDADLVIAIGTRLSDFTSASHTQFQNPDVRFLSINVSARDAHKFGAEPLVGDARATLDTLREMLAASKHRVGAAYGDRVETLKAEWDATVDDIRAVENPADLTQANVIGLVNTASGPRDVVVCAAGSLPGDLLKLWRPVDPKGYHLEYGYSTMGYEIAGGLGAKMADPSREVYVMVGDGSYLMLHTEIVTSLEEGMKLTIVVVDNGGFQCIRNLQMSTGSPPYGNELRYRDPRTGILDGPYIPIDFAANAESLGAVGMRATSEAELRDALERAKQETRTVVIHVPVQKHASVPGFESWWDVPVAEVSTVPSVKEAREEYVEQERNERFYY